jgi:hypothetical protein
MTRLLKASVIRELTILAAAVVALTVTPEKVLGQDDCFAMCSANFQSWLAACKSELPGNPTGYAYCVAAAAENYQICSEGCEV